MAVRIQVTIDCADPERQARFWAEALRYQLEEPPDGSGSWSAYWRSRGLPEEELDDRYDSIVDPDGVGPRFWFQVVPEGKVVKNRVHLDLDASGGRTVPLETRRVRSMPRWSGWSGPARRCKPCSARKDWITTGS